jgi:nitrate reductase (NAD(P)H)
LIQAVATGGSESLSTKKKSMDDSNSASSIPHSQGQHQEVGWRLVHSIVAPEADSLTMVQRLKQTGLDPLNPIFQPKTTDRAAVAGVSTHTIPEEIALTKPGITRVITQAELEASKEDPKSAWFVVRGEVYDGTGFLGEHPGGADSILLVKGEDATEDFIAIHSPEGRLKLAQANLFALVIIIPNLTLLQFHIGTLEKTSITSTTTASPAVRDTFLLKNAWSKAVLSSRLTLTHDTVLLKFEFFAKNDDGLDKLPLGLPCGQHAFVRLRRKDTGEIVQRAYTPVSAFDAIGHVELLVKCASVYVFTIRLADECIQTVPPNILLYNGRQNDHRVSSSRDWR